MESTVSDIQLSRIDKSVKIGSENDTINFSKTNIGLKAYFNGSPIASYNVKLRVATYDQVKKNIFQFEIPKGANTLKLVFDSVSDDLTDLYFDISEN